MSVKRSQSSPANATQRYLQFAEIRDDHLVLQDGSIRAVLCVSSVNFDLKSEQEQDSLIFAYQEFLNSLEFPIQIVVRSKKLDIDGYLDRLSKVAEGHEEGLLKDQTYEYIEYVRKLVELADIMQKEFYVVVPYETTHIKKINPLEKLFNLLTPGDTLAAYKHRLSEFETLRKGMKQRITTVMSGLQRCGLDVEQLNTAKLIKLLYEVYNPLTSQREKVLDLAEIDIPFQAGGRQETKNSARNEED